MASSIAQDVEIRKGEVVLLSSGWFDLFKKNKLIAFAVCRKRAFSTAVNLPIWVLLWLARYLGT